MGYPAIIEVVQLDKRQFTLAKRNRYALVVDKIRYDKGKKIHLYCERNTL